MENEKNKEKNEKVKFDFKGVYVNFGRSSKEIKELQKEIDDALEKGLIKREEIINPEIIKEGINGGMFYVDEGDVMVTDKGMKYIWERMKFLYITKVVEPRLIRLGLMKILPDGSRIITEKGKKLRKKINID